MDCVLTCESCVACAFWGDVSLGVVAADDALLLDPLPLPPVVLLSLLAYS